MKAIHILIFLLINILAVNGLAQVTTIHVLVALCDNEHQGIVPVPEAIGDGKNPKTNLYWGAGYGVSTFFNKKTSDWKLVNKQSVSNPLILERLLFKHAEKDIFLLADAYDGEYIKICVEDFLKMSNRQDAQTINFEKMALQFGGGADLLAYIGHDGLMDFSVDMEYRENCEPAIDVMILACYSKDYFSSEIRKSGASPVLWTTHLMAPEAYTLKSAIDGWILNESGAAIEERAAQTYHQYQKCGIRGARNLFTTGF